MSARGLLWLLLLWGACRGKSEPAPDPPAHRATPAAAVDGGATPADAAAADAAGPDAAPARTIAIGDQVPDLGCLGWSPQREIAACVLGERGMGMQTKVELAFFATSAAAGAPPPPITILDPGEHGGQGPDQLDPALVTRLASALRGFVPWDRGGAAVTARLDDGKLVAGPPITVGGMTIAVRIDPAPRQAFAPQFSALLTVRVPGGAQHVVTLTTGPISGLEVRGFAVRDRAGRGTVLVEQVHSVGDEGLIGSMAALWICNAAGCEAP